MTLNRNKDNNASKALKKIRFKPYIGGITRYVGTAAATVLIVGIGVFMPAFLLKGKSDIKNLPEGYVDAADVQPYGAEYARNTKALYNSILSYNNYIYDNGSYFTASIPHTEAYRSNGYAGIGIQDPAGVGTGSSNEFVYAYTNLLSDTLGYVPPDSFEVRSLSEDLVMVGASYEGDGFVLDRTTDVPIWMSVMVETGPEGLNLQQLNQLFNQTVALYNEFTGLDFFVDNDDVQFSEDGVFYSHSMKSASGTFTIQAFIYGNEYYSVDTNEPYIVWWIDFNLMITE